MARREEKSLEVLCLTCSKLGYLIKTILVLSIPVYACMCVRSLCVVELKESHEFEAQEWRKIYRVVPKWIWSRNSFQQLSYPHFQGFHINIHLKRFNLFACEQSSDQLTMAILFQHWLFFSKKQREKKVIYTSTLNSYPCLKNSELNSFKSS